MERYAFIILVVFLSFAFVGCIGSGVDDNALMIETLQSFERIIDLRMAIAGGYSIEGSIQVIKPHAEEYCYNVPSSWSIWDQDRIKYDFISRNITRSGKTAMINLTYTTTGYSGEISSELTRTFTMRKFCDKWLINLAEFIG
jgi:hypothetical protein